jgi:hypothetical protein
MARIQTNIYVNVCPLHARRRNRIHCLMQHSGAPPRRLTGLPSTPPYATPQRPGVPQFKHAHGLLGRGGSILDDSFGPDYRSELLAAGGRLVDWWANGTRRPLHALGPNPLCVLRRACAQVSSTLERGQLKVGRSRWPRRSPRVSDT